MHKPNQLRATHDDVGVPVEVCVVVLVILEDFVELAPFSGMYFQL